MLLLLLSFCFDYAKIGHYLRCSDEIRITLPSSTHIPTLQVKSPLRFAYVRIHTSELGLVNEMSLWLCRRVAVAQSTMARTYFHLAMYAVATTTRKTYEGYAVKG